MPWALSVPAALYHIRSFCSNCGGKLAKCSASTEVGRRWLGTTCCEWIAAHIHWSFVDQGDKAGAHSVTGRLGLGNGGQETAALSSKDSAESNEGQLSSRILSKLPGRGRGRRSNNLTGQISCLTRVADVLGCENKGPKWQGTKMKGALISGAGIWPLSGQAQIHQHQTGSHESYILDCLVTR